MNGEEEKQDDVEFGNLLFALNLEDGKVPEMVQLLPLGPEIVGRDGRSWTMRSPEDVIAQTQARGVSIPIDVNHSTDLLAPKGLESPAVGWIDNIVLQADGIWGRVNWNDEGRNLIEKKAYRYLSPVFSWLPGGEICAIYSAALTNRPNLRVRALNNQEHRGRYGREEEGMKKLLAALGLSETATEDQAVAAVGDLQKKAANTQGGGVDLTQYAPRADLKQMEARALNAEGALAESKKKELEKDAQATVEQAIKDRKIAPASKDAYLAMCSSKEGLEQFKKIVAASPAIIPEGQSPAGGTPPAADAALNAEETELAKKMGYSEAEWKKVKEAGK